jgi:hypothetical protein
MVLYGSVFRVNVSSFVALLLTTFVSLIDSDPRSRVASAEGENFKLQQSVASSKVDVVEANLRESEAAQELNRVKNELQGTRDQLTQVTSSYYTLPLIP